MCERTDQKGRKRPKENIPLTDWPIRYHWVSEFAPKSQQHFLSFLVGWLAALGWQALIATTAYAASVLILALAALYHPAYLPQNWHQSLLMIGIGCLGTLANTFGAGKLPLLEYVVLAVHIVGFFCILIPLWVVRPLGEKAAAGEVFGSFRNLGGWETLGTACYVGSITATGAFAGSDAAVHLAEETRDASRSVPRMMVGTVVLNGAMGFVMIITFVRVSILFRPPPSPFFLAFWNFCPESCAFVLGDRSC